MTSSDAQWTGESLAYVRPQAAEDAWSKEAQQLRMVGSQQLLRVETCQPPHDIAEGFGLKSHELAVVRERLVLLNDRPVEIATSWYPHALASGTPLAESKKIRGGAVTLLARLGHEIAYVTEEVASRLATPSEASTLALGKHAPVLVLTRLARDRNEEPVEMSVMVTPGIERRLRYEMKVN